VVIGEDVVRSHVNPTIVPREKRAMVSASRRSTAAEKTA
jgi:hypothetical protein